MGGSSLEGVGRPLISEMAGRSDAPGTHMSADVAACVPILQTYRPSVVTMTCRRTHPIPWIKPLEHCPPSPADPS